MSHTKKSKKKDEGGQDKPTKKEELLGGLYQMGGLLGKGAFSLVYKALNVRTGETVAIKQFSIRNIPAKELDTIMAEAELMKRLKHPNIVKFYGYIQKEHTLNFVIEYIENGSITSIIKNFGPLPEVLTRVYTQQVLWGLSYLHEQGIIHRDIKGCNILIAKDGTCKLADFGVSALMSEQEKRFSVVGTPYWMAPEVIEMTGHHTVSDIWSLGCTVIELLTRDPPYFELQSMAALFKIVQEPHPPLPDGISPGLKEFLLKCFIKDPTKRPTAKQLLRHSWIKSASIYGPAPMPLKGSPLQRQLSLANITPSAAGTASNDAVVKELNELKEQLKIIEEERNKYFDEVNDLTMKLLVATTEKQDALKLAEDALQLNGTNNDQTNELQHRFETLSKQSSLVMSKYPGVENTQDKNVVEADSSTSSNDSLKNFTYSKEWIQENKKTLAAQIKFSWNPNKFVN